MLAMGPLPQPFRENSGQASTGALSNLAPVIPQLLFSLETRPTMVIAIEGWSALHLIFRDVRVIALKLGVVGKHGPGDRQMMDAYAHEPAEGHIDIEDTAAHLLDQ